MNTFLNSLNTKQLALFPILFMLLLQNSLYNAYAMHEQEDQGSRANARNDLQIKNKKEIFKADSLDPHPDDPYKHRPVKLGSNFISRISESRRSFYEEQDGIGMITSEGQVRDDTSLVNIDEFVFDTKVVLGSGSEGFVYLAQHIPTRMFLAVKLTWPHKEEVKNNNEYKALARLKRIFAYYSTDWIKEGKVHRLQKQAYTFMPLIEGNVMYKAVLKLNEQAPIRTEEEMVVFDKFEMQLCLMKSLLKEIKYLSECGVYQPEPNPNNILITDNLTQATLIDFGGSERYIRNPIENRKIDPKAYNVSYYISNFFEHLLKDPSRGYMNFNLTEPKYIKDFRNRLECKPFVSLRELSDAVDELEKTWEEMR